MRTILDGPHNLEILRAVLRFCKQKEERQKGSFSLLWFRLGFGVGAGVVLVICINHCQWMVLTKIVKPACVWGLLDGGGVCVRK